MTYKILVVDDEAPVRDLFSDLFKKDGYDVKCVATGEESIELVAKEDFDVVLMDIKLTGMSGLEALKRIKDIKPGIIVIMITGFGYDEDLIAKSREYGCAGYIGKNMPVSQMISSFKLFIKTAKEKAK
ncbi:MAG TPA: response regulator [Candidatus Omnitrophota bacterium]|nr:response regulator [Candidatus Omnitrophota bacterium]